MIRQEKKIKHIQCTIVDMYCLDAESTVDVYQICKLYHNKRPGIWRSQDDYLYIYRWIIIHDRILKVRPFKVDFKCICGISSQCINLFLNPWK